MKTLRLIPILIYLLIGFHTSISMPEISNMYQYLLAILISGVIGILADSIIFSTAFSWAGDIKHMADLDSNETSFVHWILRSLFALIYFFIAKQPFMTDLVCNLTIYFYGLIEIKYHKTINELMAIWTHSATQ